MFITTRFFPTGPLGSSRAHKVLERDVLVYRRNWTIIVTGFFEPIFYLLGIGFGLGTLVGDVGDIPYAAFVAPGLMATAAMNGALFEATFNLFFKLKYAKTFDAILSTPLGPSDIAIGEVSWALTRGLLYATAFLIVMLVLGLVLSPWAILAIPGALLIGLAAASVGMAATTFMRKWQDFDVVTVVTMPMFLFSGTFFPIAVYPDWLEDDRGTDAALSRGAHAAQLLHRRGGAAGAGGYRLPGRHGPGRCHHHRPSPAWPAAEVAAGGVLGLPNPGRDGCPRPDMKRGPPLVGRASVTSHYVFNAAGHGSTLRGSHPQKSLLTAIGRLDSDYRAGWI